MCFCKVNSNFLQSNVTLTISLMSYNYKHFALRLGKVTAKIFYAEVFVLWENLGKIRLGSCKFCSLLRKYRY